jgi:hypothetical protein
MPRSPSSHRLWWTAHSCEWVLCPPACHRFILGLLFSVCLSTCLIRIPTILIQLYSRENDIPRILTRLTGAWHVRIRQNPLPLLRIGSRGPRYILFFYYSFFCEQYIYIYACTCGISERYWRYTTVLVHRGIGLKTVGFTCTRITRTCGRYGVTGDRYGVTRVTPYLSTKSFVRPHWQDTSLGVMDHACQTITSNKAAGYFRASRYTVWK